MKYPKHIFLVNRKNFEWLNFEMIRIMKKKFNTKFTIITTEKSAKKFLDLKINCILFSLEELEKKSEYKTDKNTFKSARNYEKKYNITFMHDIIMQDRRYSIKFKDIENSPWTSTNIYNLNLEQISSKIIYYFHFFETFFKKEKIDCVISRPDDLLGSVVVNIAQNKNIFITIQMVSRIFGYFFWSYGPYSDHNYIEDFYLRNKNKKFKNRKKNSLTFGSSSSFRKQNLINEFKFKNLFKIFIIITVDRILFIYKDFIKKTKSNRLTYISLIKRKFMAYFRNRQYLKISEKSLNNNIKKPYFYFPLPEEIEYFTHSLTKDFNNIYAIIIQLSSSIPSGYNLLVKEHTPNIGTKPYLYYKNLLKRPNIKIVDYKVSSSKLINKSEAIVTTAGTVALEAAEAKKKALIFANNVEYMHLDNIIKVDNINNLKKFVKLALTPMTEKERKNLDKQLELYKVFLLVKGFYNTNNAMMYGGESKFLKKQKKETNQNSINKAIGSLNHIWSFYKKEKGRNYGN